MYKNIRNIVLTVVIAVVLLATTKRIHSVAERAYSTVNRDAAIATVNGGDAEFVNVETAKVGGKMVDGIFYIVCFAIVLVGGRKVWVISSKIVN